LAYQPPATSIFLSEQISHQQPASSTFLSEQTSTSHQPPAKRTGCSPAGIISNVLDWIFAVSFFAAPFRRTTVLRLEQEHDLIREDYLEHKRQIKNKK
jgi:hypothetical protein